MTAGNRSPSSRRWRPRCRRCRRGASSPATNRPISASTARSIPIGAASMAASTASRVRPTPFSGCRRGSTSRPSCSPRPMPARRWSASWPIRATKSATIAIGTNTDPYQPVERRYRIMRRILEVLSAANHPVGIVTKSALVLRDLDLLKSMAERGLVKVALSVTTLDRKLARAMEPRASTPDKRLETLAASGRCWRAGLGHGGAGHPRADRHGDGAHPRARGLDRRQERGLRAAPAAARDRRSVHRMAQGELPRARQPRAVADALDPRRQALRCEMGRAHEWAKGPMPG